MKLPMSLLAAAAALATLVPTQAQAAQLLFTLTGDANASFTLDQNPTPDTVFPDEFRFDTVAGTHEGTAVDFFYVFFFTDNAAGGLAFESVLGPVLTAGPQLFTGTTTNPTFLTGSFSLVNYDTGQGNYTLTISNAIPEPATWAMMLIGFGAVGFAMRRRRAHIEVPAVA